VVREVGTGSLIIVYIDFSHQGRLIVANSRRKQTSLIISTKLELIVGASY
jgi:hypothetical protein